MIDDIFIVDYQGKQQKPLQWFKATTLLGSFMSNRTHLINYLTYEYWSEKDQLSDKCSGLKSVK